MSKTLPVYLVAAIFGMIVFYGMLRGRGVLFINDARGAVIAIGIIGFIMCATGALEPFVTKAAGHPLSIAGYILGITALCITLIQIFKWKVPFFENAVHSLYALAIIIIVKVVIARFGFLFR